MKPIKTTLAAVGAVLGVLSSMATILGYLKVDPADATDAAARMLYYAAPLITFAGGVLSGWGITKIWSDRRIAELKKRPTQSDMDDAVNSAKLKGKRLFEEATKRAESAEKKVRELEAAGQLDQFGAAQLLAMTDIADAMDGGGVYETISVNPICSTLQSLGVASYVSGGRKNYSRWVLVPEWLKVVRRRRDEIDERTMGLREERDRKREEDERRKAEAASRPPLYPSISTKHVGAATGGKPDGSSVDSARSPRDDISSNISAALSTMAVGIDGVMRDAASSDTDCISIPGLSPAESKMVMAIWNGGSVHVGTEGLPVAKALKSRGVIYRLDAPSSGVIEECDVALTDEWRLKVEETIGTR